MVPPFDQGMVKTPILTEKSSTSFSGGKSSVAPHKAAIEPIAGLLSLVLAGVGSTGFIPRETQILDAVICGMAGFFGAYAFLENAGLLNSRAKLVAVMIGGGFAAIFGPITSNALGYYFPWVGSVSYFVEAAVGVAIGLACTPLLGIMRNPGSILTILAGLIPWFKKKE